MIFLQLEGIQVEYMIDDTYDDNDKINRKPINNVIDDTNDDNRNNQKPINNGFLQSIGQRKGSTGMMYEDKGVLYIQYLMPDPLNNLDSIRLMPEPLDHLDSISLMPDLYSNKQ